MMTIREFICEVNGTYIHEDVKIEVQNEYEVLLIGSSNGKEVKKILILNNPIPKI